MSRLSVECWFPRLVVVTSGSQLAVSQCLCIGSNIPTVIGSVLVKQCSLISLLATYFVLKIHLFDLLNHVVIRHYPPGHNPSDNSRHAGLSPPKTLPILISHACSHQFRVQMWPITSHWTTTRTIKFLAGTRQLYDWSCRPVCPSHLFHNAPLIISSCDFQE